MCRGNGERVWEVRGRLQHGPDNAKGLLGTEGRDLCLSDAPSVPLFRAWVLLTGVEYPWGFLMCASMGVPSAVRRALALVDAAGGVCVCVPTWLCSVGRSLFGSAFPVCCLARCMLPGFCSVVILFYGLNHM